MIHTFESGNIEDLHSVILKMIENPDRVSKMDHNARGHIEQNKSPEKYYQQLVEIYKAACTRNKA